MLNHITIQYDSDNMRIVSIDNLSSMQSLDTTETTKPNIFNREDLTTSEKKILDQFIEMVKSKCNQ